MERQFSHTAAAHVLMYFIDEMCAALKVAVGPKHLLAIINILDLHILFLLLCFHYASHIIVECTSHYASHMIVECTSHYASHIIVECTSHYASHMIVECTVN